MCWAESVRGAELLRGGQRGPLGTARDQRQVVTEYVDGEGSEDEDYCDPEAPVAVHVFEIGAAVVVLALPDFID